MCEELELVACDLRKVLWPLRGDFTDVDLVCDDGKTKLPAHKIILASASKFFETELRNKNEIHLDASLDECRKLLQLVYLGRTTVDKSDSSRFVKGVVKKYQLRGIVSEIGNDDDSTSKEDNPGVKLDDLPPEIMMKIFSHLGTQDLLVNVAPVCKRFHALVQDPEAHIMVRLPANVDLGAASQFLRTATKIQELRVFKYESNQLKLKPEATSKNRKSQLFCDKLLMAVSKHTHLKAVYIHGLHASASAIYSLSLSFGNLEKLSLRIQITSRSIDLLHLELTFSILASFGKIKYLKLNGISSIDSRLIMKLASSCKQLQTLVTDCKLTNAQKVMIYEERKDSLRHLSVGSSNSWDDAIFQSLSNCTKMEDLTDFKYPFFKGIDKMRNLRMINLQFRPQQSLDDFTATFVEGSMPQIEFIGLTTSCNEDKIYPMVARSCPNLRALYVCSTNPDISLQTLRDMVNRYRKLKIIVANLQFKGCSFDVSDIFEQQQDKLKKLESIGFNFGNNPRSQAKKLFRKLPSLIFVNYIRDLFVKSTVSIETVLELKKRAKVFQTINYLKMQ